ncbi:MAG: histidine kinase [candidate division NC10 bacterium CSP1-5]|nr:MAG: histidine kinase [candidate division NC10 bacterium CSP1-5]
MEKARTLEAPVALPRPEGIFEVSRKSTVIGLRWPVVIVCAYLLLYSPSPWLSPTTSHFLLLLYVLSNAVLHRLDERLFDSSYFYIPLVLFDTLFLTTSLILTQRAGTDFYLAYFLIIILCSLWQDLRWSILAALFVSILYGYVFFKTTEIYDWSVYIRFPFLFVASLFYGYFAQVVRTGKVMREQAEGERWKTVANLAAGVAHEVKNPLAILLQGVEYLSKKADGENPDLALVVKEMEEAVHRADTVIRGMMDFASIAQLDIVPEDLNVIIERSLLLLKNQFDRAHVEVIKDLGKDLPQVRGDRPRLEQVFVNLFMNAVEAQPTGGRLRVRTYREKTSGENGVVVAEVENDGKVIPEQNLARVFDPFFTTKRNIGGTGLGLSIVKNILDMHNARIRIRNREHGGVIVTLQFHA